MVPFGLASGCNAANTNDWKFLRHVRRLDVCYPSSDTILQNYLKRTTKLPARHSQKCWKNLDTKGLNLSFPRCADTASARTRLKHRALETLK